jgi:hypothetical protein
MKHTALRRRRESEAGFMSEKRDRLIKRFVSEHPILGRRPHDVKGCVQCGAELDENAVGLGFFRKTMNGVKVIRVEGFCSDECKQRAE